MRTRMYQVKSSFKKQYGDNLMCDLCKINEDTQEHLLKCKVLQHFIPEILEKTYQYDDLFGDVDDIIEISKILYKITKERENLLTLNGASE